MKLEDLTPGTSVQGLLPHSAVTVVSVQWHGSEALTLVYRDASGRVALFEEYHLGEDRPQRVTLVQLLPDSQPVEGTASFSIGDFSYPVLHVAWRSESVSQGGATYTRQVPEYALGPAAPTHEIVVRTRSVVACSPSRDSDSGNISYYDCGPYGRVNFWAWR